MHFRVYICAQALLKKPAGGWAAIRRVLSAHYAAAAGSIYTFCTREIKPARKLRPAN